MNNMYYHLSETEEEKLCKEFEKLSIEDKPLGMIAGSHPVNITPRSLPEKSKTIYPSGIDFNKHYKPEFNTLLNPKNNNNDADVNFVSERAPNKIKKYSGLFNFKPSRKLKILKKK